MSFTKAIIAALAATILTAGFVFAQQPPVPVAPGAPAASQGCGPAGRGAIPTAAQPQPAWVRQATNRRINGRAYLNDFAQRLFK